MKSLTGKKMVRVFAAVLALALCLTDVAQPPFYVRAEQNDDVPGDGEDFVTESESETESVVKSEPAAEPVTESVPETELTKGSEPVTEPDTEPVTESEQETEIITESESETEAAAESEQETESESEIELTTEAEFETETVTESESETETVTEPVTEPEEESETEDSGETTEKCILSWEWVDDWEMLVDGVLALPGASEDMPAYWEDITELLPSSIRAQVTTVPAQEDENTDAESVGTQETEEEDQVQEEVVAITGWECSGYPEEGAFEGSYAFAASLPEGYVLAEEAEPLEVRVELGGIELYAGDEDWGWNENESVYRVVGRNGWRDSNGKVITIDHSCTVDLSLAEDPEVSGSLSYYFLINTDDVTVTFVTGDRNEPLDLGSKSLFYVENVQNPTIVLDNVKIKGSSRVYYAWKGDNGESTTLTCMYKGTCIYPAMVYDSWGTVDKEKAMAFKVVGEEGAVLNLTADGDKGIYVRREFSIGLELTGGEIITDGDIGVTVYDRLNEPHPEEPEDVGSVLVENCELSCQSIRGNKVDIVNSEVSAKGSIIGAIAPVYENNSYPENYVDGGYLKITDSTIDAENMVGCSTSSRLLTSGRYLLVQRSTVNCGCLGDAAEITIDHSEINANQRNTSSIGDNVDAAIGGYFRTLKIVDSVVNAYCSADKRSAIGKSYPGSGDYYSTLSNQLTEASIEIIRSKVDATSEKGNAIGVTCNILYASREPVRMTITIDDSEVTASAINAPAIGAMFDNGNSVIDPDAVIIDPGIGGWNEGGGSTGLETFSLRAAFDDPVVQSGEEVSSGWMFISQKYRDTAKLILKNSPVIRAESGTLAVNAIVEIADEVTPALFQNTLEKTSTTEIVPAQDTVIKIDGKTVDTMRRGYSSLALTMPLETETVTMTCGSGNDPDPLVNWNESAGPMYGTQYALTANAYNCFWTLPQQTLGGSAVIAGSPSGAALSTAVTSKQLYANINGMTPANVRDSGKKETLSYQWYKDGDVITGANANNYTPKEKGVYYYVVSGSDRYRGSVTSAAVTVTQAQGMIPDAPELESVTKDTITLKDPEDGATWEYSIDGGATWQDGLIFDNLEPNQTYSIVRREKAEEGDPENPVSAPLTVKTLGDKPDETALLDAIDYEKECFDLERLPDNVKFYSDPSCRTELLSLTTEGELEKKAYIAAYGKEEKVLYARFEGVTGTGDDVVTAIVIPARPEAPVMNAADFTATANTISFIGLEGVEYIMDEDESDTHRGDGVTEISFTGLKPDSEHTVSMRRYASNETKNFSSAIYRIKGNTLKEGVLTTTILIPKGTTEAKTYDLDEVIRTQMNNSGYSLKDAKVFADGKVIADVSAEGTELTLTPVSGDVGTAVLEGTNTSITVKIVGTVGESADGSVLWLMSGDSANLSTEAGRIAGQNDETVTVGWTRQLTPVYAWGLHAEKRAANAESMKVEIPWWDEEGAKASYILVRRDPATGDVSQVDFVKTENGIELELSGGDYGLYGLYRTKSIYDEENVEVVLGDVEYGNVPAPVGSYENASQSAVWEYTYSSDGGLNYTDVPPTELGTYLVKAELRDPGNRVHGTAVQEFKIVPRTITVIPKEGQYKYYGQTDPAAYSYDLSTSMVGGDQLTGSLKREQGEAVGTYAYAGTFGVEPSEASANYNIVLSEQNSFEIKQYTTELMPKTDREASVPGWYRETVKVSAPEGHLISLDQTNWTNELTFSEGDHWDGLYYLKSVKTDGTKDAITMQQNFGSTIDVDTTSPVFGTVSYSDGTGSLIRDAVNWILGKEAVTVTVPMTEKGSGLSEENITVTLRAPDGSETKLEAKLNGTQEKGYTIQFVVEGPFEGSYEVSLTDRVGNLPAGAKTESGCLIVDLADPVAEVEFDGQKYEAAGADCYEGSVSFRLKAQDAPVASGLKSMQYRVDDSEWIPVVIPDANSKKVETYAYDVPENETLQGAGSHSVRVKVTDHAGRESEMEETIYIFQDTPLTLTTAQTPVYDGEKLEEGVDFNVDAGASGADVILYYKEQGSDDSAYVEGLPVNAGAFTIRAVRAVDRAGWYKAAAAVLDITIKKKAAPETNERTYSYICGVGTGENAAVVDLSEIFPDDRGESSYQLSMQDPLGLLEEVNISGGALTYRVGKNGAVGDTALILVTAVSENYEDLVCRFNIVLIQQPSRPDGGSSSTGGSADGGDSSAPGDDSVKKGGRFDGLALGSGVGGDDSISDINTADTAQNLSGNDAAGANTGDRIAQHWKLYVILFAAALIVLTGYGVLKVRRKKRK